MQSSRWRAIQIGLVCGILAHPLPSAAREAYRETVGKKGWFLFSQPAKATAAEQWDYALQLEQAGKAKAAAKQYYRLVARWPQAPEAGLAQHRYAQWMDRRDKPLHAFDEYQRLFDRFMGQFPYDEVLTRQFEIASDVMQRKKGRFLFMPGFAAPERAIPLFEKIIANGPGGTRAPEAQFLIGRAHEMGKMYEEAIAAYLTTLNRYPASARAEEAGFRAAFCYYRLTAENPNDEQLLESAWAAFSVFLARYPAGERAKEAEAYRAELLNRRAEMVYRRAYFYDHISHRPEAALVAYRAFLKQFPSSKWADEVRERVDVLAPQVEVPHER